MSTNKYFDVIALLGIAAAVLLVYFFSPPSSSVREQRDIEMGYEKRLFTSSSVHRIELLMEDWFLFLGSGAAECWENCSLRIDGEYWDGAGIRIRKNKSLGQGKRIENQRYSFQIEFAHQQGGNTYYGLDRLYLYNLYGDRSYMKDYLGYRLMRDMGVPAPLCSYVWVTVNGEDWGLYLAIEELGESFLLRNYGEGHGRILLFSQWKGGKVQPNREVLIKYLVVDNFLGKQGGYREGDFGNTYLYEGKEGIMLIPWDYGSGFAQIIDGRKAEEFPVWEEQLESRPLAAWIGEEEEASRLYHQYYTLLMKKNLSDSALETEMIRVERMISPYVGRETRAFYPYQEFTEGVEEIRQFLQLRSNGVIRQLAEKSSF